MLTQPAALALRASLRCLGEHPPPAPEDSTNEYAENHDAGQRRTTEGKTKKEIMRCLKRYIAREAYHALRIDLTDLQPANPARPEPVISITCGAGFTGRTRHKVPQTRP